MCNSPALTMLLLDRESSPPSRECLTTHVRSFSLSLVPVFVCSKDSGASPYDE